MGCRRAAPQAITVAMQPVDERSAYDWNDSDVRRRLVRSATTFLDETLRDGLQNPSVTDPPIADKLELIHRMDELGIQIVNVGLPASSPRAHDDALAACREIAQSGLAIRPVAAGRTLIEDVTAIVELAQRSGRAVGVYTFIGSSPIRQYVEGWDVRWLIDRSLEAIDVAVREGLEVCFVTEDTTRSRPEALAALWHRVIDRGVTRICLTDTVGHATSEGVRSLITFARGVIAATGAHGIGLDFHGHNDRGIALDNALCALRHGADRIHATALGIGERTGNTPMELLLYNLHLVGELERAEPQALRAYCEMAARALAWPLPTRHPLFRTMSKDFRQPARRGSINSSERMRP
jgi:2-isopropylmalate synthase